MLAYAFWHWKRHEADSDLYEARQRAFLTALAGDPPPGFRSATSSAIPNAPWAGDPPGAPAYEDWYQLEDSAALDLLNEAAVTGSRRAPHQAVAELAAGGVAGLYDCRAGDPGTVCREAVWFGKPAGMSYPSLFAALAPLTEGGRAALWCRRMTLGPAPEFCLRSEVPVVLPRGIEARSISHRAVWP